MGLDSTVKTPGETDTNPIRYAGEYADATGLIYLRNRYYDPNLGRFTQEDPARDGTNWYVYCGNDPIMFVDPMGLAYIPLRATAEAEGYKVGWNPKTLRASVVGIEYYSGDGKGSFNQNGTMHVWDETYYRDTMLTSADKNVGVTISIINGKPYKDVSVPFNTELYEAGTQAEQRWRHDDSHRWFLTKVDHGKMYDIKRKVPWEQTIKSTYPGKYGTEIVMNGGITTPEKLGNVFYGYVGAGLGFPLWELQVGSWIAADTSTQEKMQNEYNDRNYIKQGYDWFRGVKW